MQYDKAFKIRAVKVIQKKLDKGEEINWSEEAGELEISTGTTLKAWFQDPRFNPDRVHSSLPTEKNSRPRKAKKIVATSFSCPHCGGPITLEDK